MDVITEIKTPLGFNSILLIITLITFFIIDPLPIYLMFLVLFLSLIVLFVLFVFYASFKEYFSLDDFPNSIPANLADLIFFPFFVMAFSAILIKIFNIPELQYAIITSAIFLISIKLSRFINTKFYETVFDNLTAILVLFGVAMLIPPVPDLIKTIFWNPNFYIANYPWLFLIGLAVQFIKISLDKKLFKNTKVTPQRKSKSETFKFSLMEIIVKKCTGKIPFILTLIVFISSILAAFFVLPNLIIPTDLPITISINTTAGEVLLNITCVHAQHYTNLIVEGDKLTCLSEMYPEISVEPDCKISNIPLTIYPVVLNESKGIEYFGEFKLPSNKTEFSFLVPQTDKFSFGVQGCYKQNNEEQHVYFGSLEKSYDGRWIIVRNKTEGDDYLTKLNTLLVTTILSLASIFPAAKFARDLWHGYSKI